MINAKMELLRKDVLIKSRSLGIEAYVLKNSKANCIAFTSDNRKRREFEITFLKESRYRVSTRFVGYKRVMINSGADYFEDNDPDGKRKRFNVNLAAADKLNQLIMNMLTDGFYEMPDVERL